MLLAGKSEKRQLEKFRSEVSFANVINRNKNWWLAPKGLVGKESPPMVVICICIALTGGDGTHDEAAACAPACSELK